MNNGVITNCDQLEHYQNTHQTRTLHQNIKELTNGVAIKERNIAIKYKNEVLLTTESDVRERWSESCKELYNHNINADNTALASLWTGQPQEIEPCILLSEGEAAIKRLKHRKSPGVDGICGELIQDGNEAASGAIFSICKRAWEEDEFPEIWAQSVIITIPKKATDTWHCENYRTISLISHASKVMLEIIRRRLTPYYVEALISEEQAGVRPGRSTID